MRGSAAASRQAPTAAKVGFVGRRMEGTRLDHATDFALPVACRTLAVGLSWQTEAGGTPLRDLNLSCLVFDEKGRFVTVVDFYNADGGDLAPGITHRRDSFFLAHGCSSTQEKVYIHLGKVPETAGVLIPMATSLSSDFRSVAKITAHAAAVAYSDAEGEGAARERARARRIIASAPLFHVQRVCRAARSTALALFKVYKDPAGPWKARAIAQEFDARTRAGYVPLLEQHLVESFPWIAAREAAKMSSVGEICRAFSSRAMPALKQYFIGLRPELGPALPVREFVEVTFLQLIQERPEVQDPETAAYMVALLHELFEQIDINGDETVDWDELTSFCIEVGMASTKQSAESIFNDFAVLYAIDRSFEGDVVERPVTMIKHVPSLQAVFVAEEGAKDMRVFDRKGRPRHSLDLSNVAKDPAATPPLAAEAQPAVHDVEYILEKDLLAVSTTNHAILLVRQQLTSSGQHKAYQEVGVMTHRLSHRRLCWNAAIGLLFSAGVTSSLLYAWDVDAQRLVQTFDGHADTIMGIIHIEEKSLMATCSLDRTVNLWSAENLSLRGTLSDHELGVRTMTYKSNILITAGFEAHAFCWDLNARERLLTLRGHHAPVSDSRIMGEGSEMLTITGDEAGEIRVWDTASSGKGDGFAVCLQVLRTRRSPSRAPLFLATLDSFSVGSYAGVLAGTGAGLLRVLPAKRARGFTPPTGCAANSVAHVMVSAIANTMFLWSTDSGDFLRSFRHTTRTDISAVSFDMPHQRRIVLGLEGGSIVIANYITGSVLLEDEVHEGDVVLAEFCPECKCVVSVGAEGSVCISTEHESGSLQQLRQITSAHRSPVVCAAYSYKLSSVVTADSAGEVRIWDFQNCHLRARIVGLASRAMSMLICAERSLLFLADQSGGARVFRYRHGQDVPLQQLATLRPAEAGGQHVTSLATVGGELVAASSGGMVYTWNLCRLSEQLGDAAREVEGGAFPCDAPRFTAALRMHVDGRKAERLPVYSACASETRPLEPTRSWRAHTRAIVSVVRIASRDPTFITSSADGFQRAWSLAGDLLGQMVLPDVEPDALRDQLFPDLEWNVPVNKVDVSDEHRQRARDILRRHRESLQDQHGRRLAIRPGNTHAVFVTDLAAAVPSSPRKGAEVGRVRWRGRSDLLSQLRGTAAPRPSPSLRPSPSSSPSPHAPRAPGAGCAQGKGLHPAAAAFSDLSIRRGVRQGSYNIEEALVLRKISKFRARRDVYDRAYPLRLPSLSKLRAELREQRGGGASGTQSIFSPYRNAALAASQAKLNFLPDAGPPRNRARRLLRRRRRSLEQRPSGPAARGSLGIIAAEVLSADGRDDGSDDGSDSEARAEEATGVAFDRSSVERLARQLEAARDAPDADPETSPYAPAKGQERRKQRPWRQKAAGADGAAAVDIETLRPGAFGPCYTRADVVDFIAAFRYVDSDGSGDLDADEWFAFTKRMSPTISRTESQQYFLVVDANGDGRVAYDELVPILFNRASAAQHRLVQGAMRFEALKAMAREKKEEDPVYTVEELQHLFDEVDDARDGIITKDQVLKILQNMYIGRREKVDRAMRIFDGPRETVAWERFKAEMLGFQAAG